MTLPGTSLLAFLTRWLNDERGKCALVSTIADLQHEALVADTAWRRSMAVARGYAAVARLLLVDGLIWRFPMRSIITVAVLGLLGAVASVAAIWGRVGSTDAGVILVFLAMAVISPLVIRRAAAGTSYRGMLLACIGVGMIMGTALFAWIGLVENPRALTWRGVLWRYLFLTGCVVLASALASAAAWRPVVSSPNAWAKRFRIVLISAAVFTACQALLTAMILPAWNLAPGQWFRASFSAVLFAFYFAGVAVAVYLPVLEGVKALVPRLDRRTPLAAIGALLFPIAPAAIAWFSGYFPIWWQHSLRRPVLALVFSLGYVISGAVLGWLLAEQPRRTSVTVP